MCKCVQGIAGGLESRRIRLMREKNEWRWNKAALRRQHEDPKMFEDLRELVQRETCSKREFN